MAERSCLRLETWFWIRAVVGNWRSRNSMLKEIKMKEEEYIHLVTEAWNDSMLCFSTNSTRMLRRPRLEHSLPARLNLFPQTPLLHRLQTKATLGNAHTQKLVEAVGRQGLAINVVLSQDLGRLGERLTYAPH